MQGALRCPRDGSATELRYVGGRILGFGVDVCPNCGGTWLDRGELRKIVENAKIEGMIRDYATTPKAPLLCPRDGAGMRRRTLVDTGVDACAACAGFSIDARELEGLEHVAMGMNLPRTSEDLHPRLEARDIAILSIMSPATLERYQRSQMRK